MNVDAGTAPLSFQSDSSTVNVGWRPVTRYDTTISRGNLSLAPIQTSQSTSFDVNAR